MITAHYTPGDSPLCGSDRADQAFTDDPQGVSGCEPCLELVAEDLTDVNEYMGHCLHCRQEIIARGGVEWRRAVRQPCPRCGEAGS